jgi:hypothetical protein
MNDELVIIWEEAVVAKSMCCPRHLSGGTEKIHKNLLSQGSRFPDRVSNRAPSKYCCRPLAFPAGSVILVGFIMIYWLLDSPRNRISAIRLSGSALWTGP